MCIIYIPEVELDVNDENIYLWQGKPFTGVAYEQTPNGKIESEFEFVNGLREGISRELATSRSRVCRWERQSNGPKRRSPMPSVTRLRCACMQFPSLPSKHLGAWNRALRGTSRLGPSESG